VTEPCKRHAFKVTGYRTHCMSRSSGRVHPKWAVYELGTCRNCPETAWRQLGTVRAPDEREAARLCGVPEVDVQALPAQTRKSPPVESPLISWPFPVSAHAGQPTKRRKAAAPAAST
jgi:hypothetical protein